MRCPNCGGETGENVKFCQFCGSQITVEMKSEMDRLNREGCPRCKSTNVHFEREIEGQLRSERGSRVMRSTVGICDDCGFTWDADGNQSHVNFSHTNPDYTESVRRDQTQVKKRKTALWVLGWIFIFPLPLTLILIRPTVRLPKALKIIFIVLAWMIYGGALIDEEAAKPKRNVNIVIDHTEKPGGTDSKPIESYGTGIEVDGKKSSKTEKSDIIKKNKVKEEAEEEIAEETEVDVEEISLLDDASEIEETDETEVTKGLVDESSDSDSGTDKSMALKKKKVTTQ